MIRSHFASLLLLYLTLSQLVEAKTLVLGGSGTDLGTFSLLVQAFNKTHPEIEIRIMPSMGSSGGIKALQHGKLDLALSSRALKPKEKSTQFTAIHYASTPLVFAVADSSTQRNISTQQIVQIYSGKLRQWPDGSVLRLILRPTNDSDSKTLRETFAKRCKDCFNKAYQQRGIPVALTDQESASMVARVPGAIGTSTLALMLSEKKSIKALMLDGVMPSAQSLSNHSYPMYKDLYMVYAKEIKNKKLQVFLDFISSKTAQTILKNTGHRLISPL